MPIFMPELLFKSVLQFLKRSPFAGEDILLPDGTLNRRQLQSGVFSSSRQACWLGEFILMYVA